MIAATVRHYFPEPVAVRTAQAVAVFPGSAVLLFTYAEGLFLLLATRLRLLHGQATVGAGRAGGAAAGGTRANGLWLAVMLGLVALHAIWTRRDWRSLVAPLLAPLGFAGYLGFVWWETGRADEWFAVEHYGWRQRNDFGAETIRVLTGPHPLDSGLLVLQLVGVGFVAADRRFSRRSGGRRCPGPCSRTRPSWCCRCWWPRGSGCGRGSCCRRSR